ncbi:MAG: MBL fold metallo-hydrolase [Planctomycetes bacterium]|nr:MBL fold metallo-hydrolase [Planctomycetota bacterium]
MGAASPPIEAVVLGSGTSHGVPMIGCRCAVCTSPDPRDRRTRPSLWVRAGETRLLIDTAPELRLQCLACGIDAVDAVLFTHHHADHVSGLDDLRRFNWLMRRIVPCYGTSRTLEALRRMFAYAFEPAADSPHSRPQIELRPIDTRAFEVEGVRVVPVPLLHGPMPVLGFRIGRFAYCTDCSAIADTSLELLTGLDVLILDALRRTPHPTHFNLEQAVAMAQRIGAGRTYFTHIAHELAHEATIRELPPGMALAYDGQRIEVAG